MEGPRNTLVTEAMARES
jgi:hypothetical protein